MSAHRLTALLASPLALASFASAQQPDSPSRLEEVIGNVQAQPLGAGTVGDLALPEDLLRRLSDRILRRSFEDNFRIVVDVPAGVSHAAVAGETAAAPAVADRSPFRTILDGLALVALAVLAVLGFFAWRARARRRG